MEFISSPNGELELAWAAGFYDGEGSTGTTGRGRNCYLRAAIDQVEPEPLRRFREAVGGLGSITGPHEREGNRRPVWHYYATHHDAIQVLELLSPYLSDPKRKQYREAKARAKKDVRRTPRRKVSA